MKIITCLLIQWTSATIAFVGIYHPPVRNNVFYQFREGQCTTLVRATDTSTEQWHKAIGNFFENDETVEASKSDGPSDQDMHKTTSLIQQMMKNKLDELDFIAQTDKASLQESDTSSSGRTAEQALAYQSGNSVAREAQKITNFKMDSFSQIMFADELSVIAQAGIGVLPSHKLMPLMDNGEPAYTNTVSLTYVDEANCVGCGLCASVAPNAFMMEEYGGKGRVFQQGSESVDMINEAIEACPAQCIHHVSFPELVALEDIREEDTWSGRDWPGAKERPKESRSGVLCAHCYNTKNCPSAGCYNCPAFSYPNTPNKGRGMNPAYIEAEAKREKSRIQYHAVVQEGVEL